ncbi:MAG: hypothetical protein IPH84_03415, partial [Bacteroidales bacterium]|nr:hypothetical protein [Bacteroidales bacterium]
MVKASVNPITVCTKKQFISIKSSHEKNKSFGDIVFKTVLNGTSNVILILSRSVTIVKIRIVKQFNILIGQQSQRQRIQSAIKISASISEIKS